MDHEAGRIPTTVIAVGNQKGGVAKTTNTVHMAAALGQLGRRCLIIDLDMNQGATRHFGIASEAFLGTYEMLIGEEQAEDVIITNDDEGVDLPENVHLISARRNLEKVEQALLQANKFIITQDVLIEPLRSLKGKYDYIFLDTAPNLTTPTIAAYKAAEFFLLSAMPETFAVQGLNNALKDIQSVRENGGNARLTLIGVVLSNVDGRLTRLARELLSYVEETFAKTPPWMRKYETTISRTTVIPAAQKVGRTIFQTEPHHKVTEQFRALAREFEGRMRMVDGLSATTLASQDVPQPEAMSRMSLGPEALEGVVNG